MRETLDLKPIMKKVMTRIMDSKTHVSIEHIPRKEMVRVSI